MTDSTWLEVAKQVPSLGVLVWLVVYFLKHIKSVADVIAVADERNVDRVRELVENCNGYQRELTEQTIECIHKNTSALERNTENLIRAVYILDKHPSKNERH